MANEQDKQKETNTSKAPETKADKKEEQKASAGVPAKFKNIISDIEKLSTIELSELVKALEERFGVSASAPMAAMPVAAAGDDSKEGADDGKSEFNIILKASGDKKIDVIKAVREISGLGLAESKAVVDGAPKTVKENAPKDEAEAAKKKLEDAGATVELE